MIDLKEWISVNDQMPVIPEGQYAVHVLCSVHDPTFEEMCPGRGSEVQHLSWDGKIFKTLALGGDGSWSWHQVVDIVTHWMYEPKAFQITDEGFKFDPKGYIGYLPVDYEPVQEAINDACHMRNWFNAFQKVNDYLIEQLGEMFPTDAENPEDNVIKAIESMKNWRNG